MMRNMFTPKPMPKQTTITTSEDLPLKNIPAAQKCFASTVTYLSDNSDEDGIDIDQSDIESESDENNDQCLQARSNSNRLPAVPPRKRRHLDVPYRT
jgi:hypothetical protein